MSLYQYIKVYPKVHKKRRNSAALSFVFLATGLALLVWSLWPIISFSLFTAPLFSMTISPVSENPVSTNAARDSLISPIIATTTDTNSDIGGDFTNANMWFPTKPQKKIVTKVNTYTISIEKLKINNATVMISGNDLNKSLVHYGGTALPGDYGTSVIFGHSVLPQFFNPTNYKTIFSTLPTLELGDEIHITFDGIDYRYIVEKMRVTEPNDLSTLEQSFDDSYIVLITCVPPGTYWARLNVKARLSKISSL